jgi:hypothetical protein
MGMAWPVTLCIHTFSFFPSPLQLLFFFFFFSLVNTPTEPQATHPRGVGTYDHPHREHSEHSEQSLPTPMRSEPVTPPSLHRTRSTPTHTHTHWALTHRVPRDSNFVQTGAPRKGGIADIDE